MNKKAFINDLKNYKKGLVFNPYTDICPVYDRYNAADIRSRNLRRCIESFLATGVDSLWIGRDLGYRGGRRTGLALTDEAHLEYASRQWTVKLQKATKGDKLAERTAANTWQILKLISERVFMWNVFPFHSYEEGNPLSNRNHNARERDEGIEILEALLTLLKPKKIVAIGNDAYQCTSKIFSDQSIYKVRHPSYGGEKIFFQQMHKLYSIND